MARENTTDYSHPQERNLLNLHKAMEYDNLGRPILRTTGSSLEWSIDVSNGNAAGMSYIEKFGMNVDVDSNKETIWDGGGIYSYVASPETVAVTSSQPSKDNSTGTGARTVEIQGLNSAYEVVTETLTVGGAAGTTGFVRVFRAKVETAGTSSVNEGVISITSQSTTTLLASIGVDGTGSNAAGRGQTFMSLYTVPAGKTAYLTQWTVGAGKQNTDCVAFILCRDFNGNGAWNSKDIITVSATTYSKDYKIPMMFTEKTDIEVRAYSTTNNALVSSTFNLILVDNV